MSATEKNFKISDVMTWLDEKSSQGHEIELCWEGGGDSGWVYFQIDGEQANSEPIIDWLADKMYSILDYGSWAGEFSANGTAIYDPATKCFEGTDYYSEDETMSFDCNFSINIPKKLAFEELIIEVQGSFDEGLPEVVPSYVIRNGFTTKEYDNFENKLTQELPNILENNLNSGDYDPDDMRYWNTTLNIDPKECTVSEDNQFIVYNNKYVEISVTSTDEKDIVLDLNDYTDDDCE